MSYRFTIDLEGLSESNQDDIRETIMKTLLKYSAGNKCLRAVRFVSVHKDSSTFNFKYVTAEREIVDGHSCSCKFGQANGPEDINKECDCLYIRDAGR